MVGGTLYLDDSLSLRCLRGNVFILDAIGLLSSKIKDYLPCPRPTKLSLGLVDICVIGVLDLESQM